MKTALIERPVYLDRLRPLIGTELIKVLVGQRRVGKSYLLLQLMEQIATADPGGQILFVNKELHEFADIRTADDLLHHVAAERRPSGRLYLLIDEIQDIAEFERALRSLQAEGGTDIYCTGSNANLLSGELATFLSGRYVEIKVFGLSYAEFLRFHGQEQGAKAFAAYLRYGGLPYLRHLPLNDQVVFDYLSNIVDAILLKDVVVRFQIRNVDFLLRLARFLADNTGSRVSARSISSFLKSQQVNVSHSLVLDYLSHLCTALLVFGCRRYDVIGKRHFEVGEKYYFEDLGIRHALVGYRGTDINRILENIVYMHLRMAGYNVSVGQMGEREIDFVCEARGERLYVQVAYQITDDTVRQREFGNLLAIRDSYPKIVVSMDEMAGGTYEGVHHLHAEAFVHRLATGASPIVDDT